MGSMEDILFLGEWCKRYERRHVWSRRTHQTVPFHWDDRGKLKRDYECLESLHHTLLDRLASALNARHQVSHSVRYWQILVDPWLLVYLAVVFNRWESLRLAFEQHGELETIAFDETAPAAPPTTYAEFLAQVLSDEWNRVLCQRIIEHRYGAACRLRKSAAPVREPKRAEAPASARPTRSHRPGNDCLPDSARRRAHILRGRAVRVLARSATGQR